MQNATQLHDLNHGNDEWGEQRRRVQKLLPLVLCLTKQMLRRGSKRRVNAFMPTEGQSGPLRSSKQTLDCPSVGFTSSDSAEDEALKRLAEILVESFLAQQKI